MTLASVCLGDYGKMIVIQYPAKSSIYLGTALCSRHTTTFVVPHEGVGGHEEAVYLVCMSWVNYPWIDMRSGISPLQIRAKGTPRG